MKQNTNLFQHAPKELVMDGFITWLLYFLDSKEDYKKEKQLFFDELLLPLDDRGKDVNDICIKRQGEINKKRADIILKFKLGNEKRKFLFENKTWTTTNKEQLESYKQDEVDRYFYMKLAYINEEEKKLTKASDYKIISVSDLANVLVEIKHIHNFVEHYYEFITETFLKYIETFDEILADYTNRKSNDLGNGQFQQYIIDNIYKNLDGKLNSLYLRVGSSSGQAWTHLEFCSKQKAYGEVDESIFLRLDTRSDRYYLRLNQYAKIHKKFGADKKKRLEKLQKIAATVNQKFNLKEGKLSNRGLFENEIIVFFVNDEDYKDGNNLNELVEVLPAFCLEFEKEYQKI